MSGAFLSYIFLLVKSIQKNVGQKNMDRYAAEISTQLLII